MVVGASSLGGRWSAVFSIFASMFGVLGFGALAVSDAEAADAIIKRGDAVVTGFSGVKTENDVPKDVHPLDRTFINLDGFSAQIFDLTTLGGAARGQLADVPSKLQIKARDVGQVFGVTLDDGDGKGAPPNAYLTSTSMYGLQIVSKDAVGKINRLVAGEPGAAWMPGQFGADKGGTPGSIYKVDGVTGAVSLFATIKLYDQENAGAALGNITFDPKSRLLFVSDLETGMIHSLSLDGKERDYFDHGKNGRAVQGLASVAYDAAKRIDISKPEFKSEDPKTWGFAEPRRRVFGVAVNMGRLYYSVAEGPSVWSVGIDDEGDFKDDARIELEVAGTPSDITDILFDGSGLLHLAQRGMGIGSYDYLKFATPQKSAVLRYKWDEKDSRWAAQADEYAVGLPEEFRGTVGGIASSYGYDKFGNVDFGQCRQTLWSTGEHLREGKDKEKIAKGGARIVHGLQGAYKKSVLPKNAPPEQSWFTDYDGRNSDADAFGHIGDVAIYAPCGSGTPDAVATEKLPPGTYTPEPSTGVDVYPPLVYVDPPVYEPGLVVDKICHPGAIGGVIRCSITVTNIGSAVPVEDVKVKDVTKVMFGPGAGTLVPIVAVNPGAPGISCTPVPSTNFSCVVPAPLLLPGLSAGFDVFINTHDLALAGNLGFRNCASINHPNGWGKACAEGGADILVEKVGPATCLPGGTCKYGLKILNNGSMAYSGDVLLADAMFIGGATPNIPVTSVVPPIACIAGNTTQLPFTCLSPLSLMPGEEKTHWIEVTMPAPGGYWAENCFGALDPALLGGAPVPPGLGGGGAGVGNPSCVWTHVKVPVANLKIEKTALHGGMCTKVGADLHCDYDISVTNEDAVPFNGPLKIEEVVPATASIISTSAPWACMGGPPNYSCHTGGAVMIPAGGTTSFTVTVKINVVDSEASFCKVDNTAKISMPPGGAAPNLSLADDVSSDTASTFGLFWEDPITHITFVMCDPTNQKVKKSVSKPFQKTANGFEGEYLVTVTNTGPDPYKGPYKLNEKFGVAPTSVSFDGDFTCSGSGTDYVCETPVKDMPKNGVVTLRVKATFPDNGTCEAPNTATLTMPPAHTKGNGDASDDSAMATATLPSEQCTKQNSTPIPPVVIAKCPDGLPIPRSGKCPCKDGMTWNRDAGQCQGDEPQEPKGCEAGPHEYKSSKGKCLCDDGYSRADNGRCVKDQPEPQQPKGCEPGPHEYQSPKGKCLCDDGYSRADNGRCVKDSSPEDDCNAKGWTWTGKRCVPPKTPEDQCNDRGWEWTGKKCVPPSNPADECKEKGWTWTGKRCLPPKTPEDECNDRGWEWTGKKCVPPRSPQQDCEAKGWDWTGKKCVPPADPGAECRENGGKWTGKRCVYPPKEEPQPAKCPKGFVGTPPKCKPIIIDIPDIIIKPKRPKGDDYPSKPPRGNVGDYGDRPSKGNGPIFKSPGIRLNPGMFQKMPGAGRPILR